MNITGSVPVNFLPSVPAGAGQNLQKLAVKSASGSAESSASGNNSDHAAGGDGTGADRTVRSLRGGIAQLPARASGESVLDARIKSQETPRDQLVAAQYELVGRQQDLLRASTRLEQSRAVRDIADLREMIAVLKIELGGEQAPDRAEPPSVKSGD